MKRRQDDAAGAADGARSRRRVPARHGHSTVPQNPPPDAERHRNRRAAARERSRRCARRRPSRPPKRQVGRIIDDGRVVAARPDRQPAEQGRDAQRGSDPRARQRRPRLRPAVGAAVRGRSRAAPATVPSSALTDGLVRLRARRRSPAGRTRAQGLTGAALGAARPRRLRRRRTPRRRAAGRVRQRCRSTRPSWRGSRAQVPAILPVRFGTLLESEELEEALQDRDEEIAEAFALVRGRVQFTWRAGRARGRGADAQRAQAAARGASRSGGCPDRAQNICAGRRAPRSRRRRPRSARSGRSCDR